MVEDAQTKILRALAKLRGRPESDAELGHLARLRRLQDAIEDVDGRGVDMRTVAEELAGVLEDFAGPPQPVEVFSRETAAGSSSPLMALSLLLAIEAEEREDVRQFRREHLPAGWLASSLPRSVVFSDRLFGRRRLMTESSGEWWSWVRWGAAVPTDFRAFEELRELSVSLAADYSWHETQAGDFILTGSVPLLPGIVTTGRLVPARPVAATYITLECSPVTTPRAVATAYAAARRQLLGPRHRPVSEKHLALLVFGADQRAPRPRPSWKVVLAKWNGEHPEWSYTSSHLLARDWRVARERVLRPRAL